MVQLVHVHIHKIIIILMIVNIKVTKLVTMHIIVMTTFKQQIMQ